MYGASTSHNAQKAALMLSNKMDVATVVMVAEPVTTFPDLSERREIQEIN